MPSGKGADDGSSPHTRGALSNCEHDVSHSTDHPRIRGEHSPSAFLRSVRFGSSPHTRGALKVVITRVDLARIIPAYAGSTSP